jgi:hypothetical protein
MKCSIEGCTAVGQKGHKGKRGLVKGMCQKHYRRTYRYGSPTVSKDIVIGENRAEHPLWQTYMNMIQRCTNPKDPRYKWYGGSGITVDKRWLGRNGFPNFVKDVGERPIGKSLDRWPDPYGSYTPSNVRWATAKEQANNKRGYKLFD